MTSPVTTIRRARVRLTGRRAYIEWLVVGLGASLLVALFSLGQGAAGPGRLVYDAFARLDPAPSTERVTVVAIDNRSVEAIGRWPWPRSIQASLIDAAAAANPVAVGYDVLLLEPQADQDAVLADALSRAGNVVLPHLIESPGEDGQPWRVVDPPPSLIGSAAGLGHVGLPVDADGSVRSVPLFLTAEGQVWPHLVVRVLERADHVVDRPATPADQPGLTAEDSTLISFSGPAGTVRTVSAIDLLNGETPRSSLEGQIVLIGVTADGAGDRFPTPFAGRGLTPGVEVLAALTETLIRGDARRPLSGGGLFLVSLIPVWLLMAGFLVFRPGVNLVLGLVIGASVAVASWAAFMAGVWASPLPALAGLALAWPLWSWRRLEAAAAYLQTELATFERQASKLAWRGAVPSSGDVIDRQATALRSALSDLRDASAFAADALRGLPDATLILDEDGRVLMSNDRAVALMGPDLSQGADAGALIVALGAQRWELGSDDEAEEVITPSGHYLKIDQVGLRRSGGGVGGHIVRLADVSDLRAAERQRERALQLLGHDMRSPQASILALIASKQDRADPAFATRIGGYAQRTLHLAEAYVQQARAESSTGGDEVVDLGQVLAHAIDSLWPQAEARSVRILEPDTIEERLVVCDPSLLMRAFVNLLDNAVKFSPVGGEVFCDIVEGTDDGLPIWRVSIGDAGPGIPQDSLAQLSVPFGRASHETAGVGLGLTFVRTVAARYRGRLEFSNRPAGGALITLLLPQAPADIDAA